MKEIYKFFTDEERIERRTVTANMADIAIRKSQPNYLATTEYSDELSHSESNHRIARRRKAQPFGAEVPGRPGFYYTRGDASSLDIELKPDDDEASARRAANREVAVKAKKAFILKWLERNTSQ